MPLPGRRALLGGLLTGAALSASGPALAKLFAVGKRNAETFALVNGLQIIGTDSCTASELAQAC